jgi:hypothetical protein
VRRACLFRCTSADDRSACRPWPISCRGEVPCCPSWQE